MRSRRRSFRAVVLMMVLVALVAAAGSAAAQGSRGPLDGDRIPNPPGKDITATVDGVTHNQPVGQAQVDIAVDLDGSEEAEIGKTYSLVVAVQNNSLTTAANVRVPISLAVTAGDNRTNPAQAGVRYVGAEPTECPQRGNARLCPFGDIPPGESRTATVRVDVARAARPGRMTFSAVVETDSAVHPDGGPKQQKAVAVVLSPRRKVDADLQLTMTGDARVVGPAERFAYVLQVTNASEAEATEVDVDLRYRLGIRESGKFRELATGARSTVNGQPAPQCAVIPAGGQRCRLGSLGAREMRRVTVEFAVVHDFAPGQWGRLALDAKVSSAENDPAAQNNRARAFTNVVSRLPTIRTVIPVPTEGPTSVRIPVDAVRSGQIFAIEARYMALDVEPSGLQPWVRVSVDGGEGLHVALGQSEEFGSDRVFRSRPLRIVPPGQEPAAGDGAVQVIRAAPGRTLRILYEAAHPVGGPSRAETRITVRPEAASSSGGQRPAR